MTGIPNPSYSSNDVWVDEDVDRCLTLDLEAIESDIEELQTGKANTDHVHTGYVSTTASNEFNGEQKFINSQYCPSVVDSANGIGCAFKASRGLVNEALVDKLIMTPTTGKLPIYTYASASDGGMNGLVMVGYIDISGNAVFNGTLSASNLKDSVIEQGTQGNLIYRKWQSGISEAWYSEYFGNVSLTESMAGGVWSNELYYARGVNLPSGLFVSAPCVTCNACSNGYTCSQVSNISASLLIYRIWSPYHAEVNGCSISIHAIGRWK